MREVTTARSRFVLCQQSQLDPRFPKYPPQPVAACIGYEWAESRSDEGPPQR